MRLLNISPTKRVLEEVFNQVISTNVITRDERKRLRNVLSVNYLDDDNGTKYSFLTYIRK